MNENESTRPTLFGVIPLDIAIPVLISLLSIMTAFAAYKAAVVDSASFDRYFEAQSALNTSNSLYIEANQNVIQDTAMYDNFRSNTFTGNKRLATYYFDLFSDELMASYERDAAAFDDIYYEEIYKSAEDALSESGTLFKKASHDSDRAVSYQLTVLIMAVGLSFAAWMGFSVWARTPYAHIVCQSFGYILFNWIHPNADNPGSIGISLCWDIITNNQCHW